MKRNLHGLFAVLLVLLLLSGCAPKLESLPPEEENFISPEEMEMQDQLAAFYEKYNRGLSFAEGEEADPDWFAFGMLYSSGMLDPYWQESDGCWLIPMQVLWEANRLYFSGLPELSEWEREQTVWIRRDTEESGAPISLVREDTRRLGDGTVSVTYRRVSGDHVLTPVTYAFLSKASEMPESSYQPGDTLYEIVSVTQREDLLPKAQPQTIEIATAEELLAAAQRINEGGYASRHDTYRLTADIDLAGVEWTPMGLNNRILSFTDEDERDPNVCGFSGVFDGQGHTVYNLTITEEQSTAFLGGTEQNFPRYPLGGVGFFYRVGPEGVVKNLRLENASVSVPIDDEQDNGHAGILAMSCSGRLENISVQGKVQGVSDIGGLVGYLGGGTDDNIAEAENCTADIEVSGCDGIGGLVGCLHYGALTNCAASGTVTAIKAGYGIPEIELPRNIGGLVGHGVQGRAIESGASVYVSTQVSSRCVGGLGGLWESGGVVSCWVDGRKLGGWEPVDDYHRLEPETPEVEVR